MGSSGNCWIVAVAVTGIHVPVVPSSMHLKASYSFGGSMTKEELIFSIHDFCFKFQWMRYDFMILYLERTMGRMVEVFLIG